MVFLSFYVLIAKRNPSQDLACVFSTILIVKDVALYKAFISILIWLLFFLLNLIEELFSLLWGALVRSARHYIYMTEYMYKYNKVI